MSEYLSQIITSSQSATEAEDLAVKRKATELTPTPMPKT